MTFADTGDFARFLVGSGLGAIAGSFLATVVVRWPAGLSVARGRSRCDRCDASLGPVELVPLLGYVLAQGMCRHCGARIDPIHPIVEIAASLTCGLAFLLVPMPAAIILSLAGWLLITLAALDARHLWLPDKLTFPLAALGLTLGDWAVAVPFQDRAIGAALGYLGLFLISRGYRLLRGHEGLGLGDAKLLGGIGAWLGWQALPFLLLGASVAGLVLALALKAGGRPIDQTTRLPLGTLMCLAVLPTWAVSIRLYG